MTTVEKLNYLISIKSDIKVAIENKGVDMTGVSFPGYASKIEDISSSVGYTNRDVIEVRYQYNISNSASFVYSSAFESKQVETVNLPNCLYVGKWAFANCISLSQVSLPVCSSIDEGAFRNCDSLSQVSFPVCSYIKDNAFWYCSSLSRITIGYSDVCSLGSSVFYKTKITSSTGSIYVPSSLVSAYKTATNWSYFKNRIFAI